MTRVAALLCLVLASAAYAATFRPKPQGAMRPNSGTTALGGTALSPNISSDNCEDPAAVFDLDVDALGSGNPTAVLAGFPTMTQLVDCDGEDATSSELVCDTGGAMPHQGAGDSPTRNVALPLTSTTRRGVIVSSTGKWYEASNTALADIATEDFVVEAFVWTAYDGTGVDVIASKRDDGGTGNGWQLGQSTATAVQFVLDAGATATTATCTVVAGAWYHVVAFADRSSATGQRVGCNSVLGTAVNPTGASGTLTTSDPFRIGSGAVAGDVFSGVVAWVKVWNGTGTLATTGYQTEARRRKQAAWGSLPGTAANATLGATSRNSVALVDIDRDHDGVRRLFNVGNNGERTATRRNTVGDWPDGILVEPAGTNTWDFSDVATDASWIKTSLGVTDDQMATPLERDTSGDAVKTTPGSGNVEHYLEQTQTVNSSVGSSFSCFVKAGSSAYAWMRDRDDISNTETFFDLATCAALNPGAGVTTQSALDMTYGNGWCRVSISWLPGASDSHGIDLGYSNTDNRTIFDDDGNDQTNIYVWRCQFEQNEAPSSPIKTVGTASVTRATDSILYAAFGNLSCASTSCTVEAETVCPNYSIALNDPGTQLVAATTNSTGIDGGDNIFLNVDETAEHPRTHADGPIAAVPTTLWDVTFSGTADVFDGNSHALRFGWRAADVTVWYDAVAGGTAVPVAMPHAPASVASDFIGLQPESSQDGNCLVTRLRIWDQRATPCTE